MVNESLNYNYNSCSISLLVAGSMQSGSGFIYVTPPTCDYNYIITAKHIFQEGNSTVAINRLSDITVKRYLLESKLEELIVKQASLANRLYCSDKMDLAILKIDKEWMPKAKRIYVRNIMDVENESLCESVSFPTILRDERTKLTFEVKDNEQFCLRLKDAVKDIAHFNAISGSGIFLKSAPYLIGVIASYRLQNFELNEICVSKIDWGIVNLDLKARKWFQLEMNESKYSKISDNREIINIGDVLVNGVSFDFYRGIDNLGYDLRDDWFFDPLHYADMCNKAFVLEYFSIQENRINYKAEKMPIAYLPKKTLILRKAMIGRFIDRLVYTSLLQILGPAIDRNLSPYVFSARYNKENVPGLIVNGVQQWIKMNYLIKDWIEEGKGCLVKVDLLNYYDTINKEILIRLLYEIASSNEEKKAVVFLNGFLQQIDEPENKVGIPQNCDASSLLATFYVSHVDEFMLSRALNYCRFMDDIYFVAADVYEARHLLQLMEKELRSIGLALNAQKVEFISLDDQEKTFRFRENIYSYDHTKQMIYVLMRSHQKARRMNAMAKLMEEVNQALFNRNAQDIDRAERSLKFCLHILSTCPIKLYTGWEGFLNALLELVDMQENGPSLTPLLCQILASLSKARDISNIKEKIAASLMKGHFTYEWQTYNLWMLLAYLKYQTPELLKYAAQQIDSNDETRRIEVAAIMIYMATIKPKYNRILLHKLRNGQIHGYVQQRCALIACRAIESEAIDDAVKAVLPSDLQVCHSFLNKHKERGLIYFHRISSTYLKSSSSLFPEFYSGL